MPLSPKTRLGTYEILGPLGAGGMGEVYRAKDLRLGREIAIKVLPSAVASSADRLARFEREARTVAGLNHPNIVTLHSVEDEDGIRFLTMELVEGQTLSSLVSPGGFPLPRLLELAIPLTDALVAAHEKGVIHRDLKPGNVLVTREGRVKVLDFSLAKIAGCGGPVPVDATTITADAPVSTPGQVMGTLHYMAPEQLRGEAGDARTDLFSLGIVLYELATGRRPFAGATPAEVLSAILRDRPESLSQVRADLPVDLERIVIHCLEKDPRERAQSALEVYNELRRVQHGVEHGASVASDKAPAEGITSIAVLPFVNRSRDENDEYFSDGLADELLTMLAKIRGLRVAARTSAFHFKGKDTTIAEVGSALNVATVLEGSVRKAGNRVRISVQLVKVSDGYHLWSEAYDRKLEDILAVQEEIAEAVVMKLRSTLLGRRGDSLESGDVRTEVAMALKGRGQKAEAHTLYLQGRFFLDRLTPEDTAKGIRYLKEALNLDPDYPNAWVELARAYASEAGYGWVPFAEGYERAREAVKRALALEPDLPEGHAALAYIKMVYDYDWHGAEASYRRALQLAPESTKVLRGAGSLARSLGRFEDAIELMRRAVEQDPLSAAAYNNLGFAYSAAGRLAEAETACRKALELAPERVGTRAFLAQALLSQGRSEEALAEAMCEPHDVYRLWAQAIAYHAAGRKDDSDKALGDLKGKHAEHAACQIAEVHAVRGETDAAFEWLERAYAQRGTGLSAMKSIPRLRSLHGDPRWAALLRSVGFTE